MDPCVMVCIDCVFVPSPAWPRQGFPGVLSLSISIGGGRLAEMNTNLCTFYIQHRTWPIHHLENGWTRAPVLIVRVGYRWWHLKPNS